MSTLRRVASIGRTLRPAQPKRYQNAETARPKIKN
jgi:hypothetical protein